MEEKIIIAFKFKALENRCSYIYVVVLEKKVS